MNKFFDENTGMFLLDEMVSENPSFKMIMEDNIVTEEEIANQTQEVVKLFKELETELSEKELEKVIKAVTEMSVLYAISQYKQLQDIQHGNI